MIIKSVDNETHLLELDDNQPIFNGCGGLLCQCGLWVKMRDIYSPGDIEISCEKCSLIEEK